MQVREVYWQVVLYGTTPADVPTISRRNTTDVELDSPTLSNLAASLISARVGAPDCTYHLQLDGGGTTSTGYCKSLTGTRTLPDGPLLVVVVQPLLQVGCVVRA